MRNEGNNFHTEVRLCSEYFRQATYYAGDGLTCDQDIVVRQKKELSLSCVWLRDILSRVSLDGT